METYHKIQSIFKRDLDGSLTGKKGKMIEGAWTTPELEYLANTEWEFTEKVDGTNIRIGFCPDKNHLAGSVEFAGRSDNAIIPIPLLEYLRTTFMPNVFLTADLPALTLFGEGYGPGIQGGGKYRDDHSFVLFDVRIGQWWLSRHNVDDIAFKLGIDSVPVIGHGTLAEAIDLVASRGSSYQMKSQWGDFEAEGIVARPVVDMFDRQGNRIITKVKAVDFR